MKIIVFLLLFANNLFAFNNNFIFKAKNKEKSCSPTNSISKGIQKSFNFGKNYDLCQNFTCANGFIQNNGNCIQNNINVRCIQSTGSFCWVVDETQPLSYNGGVCFSLSSGTISNYSCSVNFVNNNRGVGITLNIYSLSGCTGSNIKNQLFALDNIKNNCSPL